MSAQLVAALLLPFAAFAPDGGGAPGGGGAIPEELRPLLEERGKDGELVVPPELQRKLAQLPQSARRHLAEATELMILTNARHLRLLLSLELQPDAWELLLSDNCIICHTDPVAQKRLELMAPDPAARGAPLYMDLNAFLQGAHFQQGLSCAGCHGGSPRDESMTDPIYERWPAREDRYRDRSWIPAFCGDCHSDSQMIAPYAPNLPTDQLQKYRGSHHGQTLLLQGDSKSAQCVSCHGAHGIRGPRDRQSRVHALKVPATCGACHADSEYMAGRTTQGGQPLPTDQLAEFRASVHGRALLEHGSLQAPACNDCHGSHSSVPEKVRRVAHVCGLCHAKVAEVHRPSSHRQVFIRQGWGDCGRCHGEHGVQAPTPEMIDVSSGGLCGGCHALHAEDPARADEVSLHFRTVLTTLRQRRDALAVQIERLAERGADVEPLEAELDEVQRGLIDSQTHLHAFDLRVFDEAASGGHRALLRADALVAGGWDEIRERTVGLAGAIGAMVLLALGLMLKIRQVDRRRRAQSPPP